ncbi:hypothetical protein Tco_0550841 [Tanacetum coccineum]
MSRYAVPNSPDMPYPIGPTRRIQDVRYAISISAQENSGNILFLEPTPSHPIRRIKLPNTPLEEEKARRRGKVYNWETATYGKIWDNEDVHDLGSVETEFPAIVFNDMLTFESALSCEPTVSSLNNDEIDFRISFDESGDEDCMIIFDKN